MLFFIHWLKIKIDLKAFEKHITSISKTLPGIGKSAGIATDKNTGPATDKNIGIPTAGGFNNPRECVSDLLIIDM